MYKQTEYMWSLLIGYKSLYLYITIVNCFWLVNFAEYEDSAMLESHIENVQESLLKITKQVKESKEKAQEKQKF